MDMGERKSPSPLPLLIMILKIKNLLSDSLFWKAISLLGLGIFIGLISCAGIGYGMAQIIIQTSPNLHFYYIWAAITIIIFILRKMK
jgi:hypothetical protein